MFNNKDTIEINKKLDIARKLLQEQVRQAAIKEIEEAQDKKIDEWWKNEQTKIREWTPEYRAFMEAHTFTPDEKSSERYNRAGTNQFKKLENR